MTEQPTAASLIADSAKWVWDNYGEGFTEWLKEKTEDKAKEKGVEIAQNRWKAFQWQRAEKEYREKLAKLYGTTRILGNSEPTPLEGIFTDLYILDKPLAMRRYSLDDLQASDEKLRGHELQRCEGIEVVKRSNSHRLFILGKPGAGKTTFLKYITLQAVKGELPQTPIFVGLREWSESNKSLMEFIVEQFAICNFPKADSFIEYLLEKGKAILLLDGLDEVNNEHNQKVIKEVKNFCKKYDKTQCLITCRVAAADYSFDDFKYMEVADFTLAQIETFVWKWFAKEGIKSKKFLTEFKQEQYRGLHELASNPLLLGMLCLAFSDSMELSTRRVDIYEDAIDALLRKWDTSRSIIRDVIYRGLNHHLKKRLFSSIAHKTFTDNQYLISEQRLIDYLTYNLKKLPNPEKQELDGEVVLKAIEAQHGIFVERAQKIHSFAHLTFQEYFAACAIKGNENHQKELMKHITELRWSEVFLLTVNLLDDADNFFRLFQKSISDLINQDINLVKFLQWAEYKSKTVQCNYITREICFFYMFFELTRTINHDFSVALALARSFDPPLDDNLIKAFNFTFDLIKNFTFTKNMSEDYVRAFERAFTFEHARNRVLPRIHSRVLTEHSNDIGCDYLMYSTLQIILHFASTYHVQIHAVENYKSIVNFFYNDIQQVMEWGFTDLSQELSLLGNTFPNQKSSQEDWKIFIKQFSNILQNRRNITMKWNFTNKQYELLNNYFFANKLLLDCLKLATVSDRETIKNSLFLPPSN